MTHADMWRAIDEIAADNNLSCSGLAVRSGLCSTAFNKSKRLTSDNKPRWISTQSIAKVLNGIGADMSYFARFVDKNV